MATSKSGDKPVKPASKTASKPAAKAAKVAKVATPAKTPAAKAEKKVVTPRKATAAKKQGAPALTAEQRSYYVEIAAYYIAERRGFHGGSELDDWVQAEKEIDRLLEEGILRP